MAAQLTSLPGGRSVGRQRSSPQKAPLENIEANYEKSLSRFSPTESSGLTSTSLSAFVHSAQAVIPWRFYPPNCRNYSHTRMNNRDLPWMVSSVMATRAPGSRLWKKATGTARLSTAWKSGRNTDTKGQHERDNTMANCACCRFQAITYFWCKCPIFTKLHIAMTKPTNGCFRNQSASKYC